MMPSILSIAFPQENPSLNRAGAALIPAVLIIALCLDGIMSSLERMWTGAKGVASSWGIVIALIAFSCWQNFDLIFRQYDEQYRFFNLNSSAMGEIVRDFLDSGNTMEQVFVLEYPYWVDSRLVAIAAGHPEADPFIEREYLFDTLGTSSPLLFLFNQQDTSSLEILTLLYPQGILNRYTSDTPRQDFWIYTVTAGSRDP